MGLGAPQGEEREKGAQFLERLRVRFPEALILVVSSPRVSLEEVVAYGANQFLYREEVDELILFQNIAYRLVENKHKTAA